jgi:hypothetical protein
MSYAGFLRLYYNQVVPDYTGEEMDEARELLQRLDTDTHSLVKHTIQRTGCKVQWALKFAKVRTFLASISGSFVLSADTDKPGKAYLTLRSPSIEDVDAFLVLSDLLQERFPLVLKPPRRDVPVALRHPMGRAILDVLDEGATYTTRALRSALRKRLRNTFSDISDSAVYQQACKLVRHKLIQKTKKSNTVTWSKCSKES